MASSPIPNGMETETNRLASFLEWPGNAKAHPTLLSRAGFYYTGDGLTDEVTCFSCNGTVRNWREGAVPKRVHRARFPECSFINHNLSGITHGGGYHFANDPERDELPSISTPAYSQPSIFSDLTTDTPPNNPPGRRTTPRKVRTQTREEARNQLGPSYQTVRRYRNYDERVKSFSDDFGPLTTMPQTPVAYANSGFFFCGPDDTVQCAWCYGKLLNWGEHSLPLMEHRKFFPNCPKYGTAKHRGQTGNSNFDRELFNNAKTFHRRENFQDLGTEDLGIVTSRPSDHKYTIYSERVKTFGGWNRPPGHHQSPENMATAGFYLQDLPDKTKCFYCEGSLVCWEPLDDPFTEHALWFPDCGYMKQIRGEEFIKKTQENYTGPKLQDRRTSRNSNEKLTSGNQLPINLQEEIDMIMTSPNVTEIEQLGIPTKAIKAAITRKLQAGNGHFNDNESLLEAALKENDKLHQSEPSISALQIDKTHNKDMETILAENTKLKEERICRICMDDTACVVFLPCAHLLSCAKCAPCLQDCPTCRIPIKGTVRTFMS